MQQFWNWHKEMDGWAQMDDGLEEGLEIRQDSRDRIMEVQAMRIQELEGVIASLSAELENLRKENVNLATRLSQVMQMKVPELQCQFSFPLHSSFVKPN
jgi:predicted methyltransferase